MVVTYRCLVVRLAFQVVHVPFHIEPGLRPNQDLHLRFARTRRFRFRQSASVLTCGGPLANPSSIHAWCNADSSGITSVDRSSANVPFRTIRQGSPSRTSSTIFPTFDLSSETVKAFMGQGWTIFGPKSTTK